MREIPRGAGHDKEMIEAVESGPNIRVVGLKEREKIKTMEMAGVVKRAVQIRERSKGGVIRDENGVGEVRVRSEARIFKKATVEEEFQEMGVGSIPGVGTGMGLGAKTMVGEIRAEIRVKREEGGTI